MGGHFWEKKNWEHEDLHLLKLQNMPFNRVFPDLKVQPGIHVIRGPRQVGKSSFLKTILSKCTREKRSCYFQSCETIASYQELTELLLSLKEREIIFLDEISFIPEWSRAVKHVVDSGSQQVFIITGSNANDLRKGIDLMPGRWGEGGEIELLPMDFNEFVQMRKQAKYQKLLRVEELELYFKVGGFPSALAESGNSGKAPLKAMKTYLQWIKGDLVKLGKIETYAKELLGQIAKTTGSTISMQTLAAKTQMGSHHTAQEYVQILETCFALRTLYAIDLEEENFKFRKEKKLYFTDPLIYWIAHEWCGLKPPANATEKIAEMVAHEALARKFKRFGYFSNKKGEVDFVFPKSWAIEVKWADAALNLSKTYLDLKIPSKAVWTKSNFLIDWPRD